MIKKLFKLHTFILLLFVYNGIAQPMHELTEDPEAKSWVDSVFNAMTPDERLGQLFMIRAHSDKGPEHVREVSNIIKEYKVGGLCFFQGTPNEQARLTNQYQAMSTTPMMIAIDGEWGLGMRMKKTTISYPRQLMLGAIKDNDLIYDFGAEVARQFTRLGIHINFAPVVDVNNNPNNPVINTRSFGEDRFNVAAKGYMYMKGMQDNGLLACAKHFPGHGDTDVDSHYDLPVIRHDRKRLDSLELLPFRVLADHGVGSIMVAHLSIPAIDNRPNRPTSLSKKNVTGLLKNELGYNGLIFTDGLGMKGVTKHFKPGEVEAEALLAGNDVLLLPEDIAASFKAIHRYLDEGKLSESQINRSVKKVLYTKYYLGLNKYQPVKIEGLMSDINHAKGVAVKQKLIEKALTLVRNQDDMLPFKALDSLDLASISIGSTTKTKFQQRLDSYYKMKHYQADKTITSATQRYLFEQVNGKDVVIISLHDVSSYARKDYGFTESEKAFVKLLAARQKVVLVLFGTPYALKYFDDVEWVLEAYQEDAMVQDAAAQALFGGIPVSGRLPITASSRSAFNTGIETVGPIRIGFSIPEGCGMDSDTLKNIRPIIEDAMKQKAMPGCVVMAIKDGKVVYHEAFGYHTFARREAMQKDDIFDLASITKVAATTLSVMKMQENGLVNINDTIGRYIPELRGTNKSGLIIKDIMAHHAGLISWIPFYQQTLSGSRRHTRASSEFYHKTKSKAFSIEVADDLYMRADYQDSIWYQIIHSNLRSNNNYRYSDLGFYLMSMLVNKLSTIPLDEYADRNLYRPLCLGGICYNPIGKVPSSKLVPSEKDNYWRRQELKGHVHDMGAAMLGGVSGHAGLFSSAQDLGILMQMLIWDGRYGGRQIFEKETIDMFTQRPERSSRRGIGFDMPQTNPDLSLNLSPEASIQTFGHLGFTGTAVWADPENDLIYVFLSNRTYPSMRNYKINKLDVRPRVQSELYKAIYR